MKRVGLDQILADLKDSDPEIKKLAAKALIKDPSCSDQIIASVLADGDKSTASVIYDILFEDEGDYSTVFRSASKDQDPLVRRMSIRYLFRKGMFTLDDGIRWLGDEDPYVRRRVISYLFWINDKSALEHVVHSFLEDADEKVRKDALRLVGIWGTSREIGKVISALEDSSSEVRMQAIKTLKRLTGEDFGEPTGTTEDEFEWIIAKWQGWWELMRERI